MKVGFFGRTVGRGRGFSGVVRTCLRFSKVEGAWVGVFDGDENLNWGS